MRNLLPKEIAESIPKLYEQEYISVGEKDVYARFYFPRGSYVAYLFEYDIETSLGYGFEMGYINLKEMEDVDIGGLRICRDTNFKKSKVKDIRELQDWSQRFI